MTAGHVPAIAAIERACFPDPWSETSLAEELHVPSAVFLTCSFPGWLPPETHLSVSPACS